MATEDSNTKICTKCRIEKPKSSFSRDSSRKDFHADRCKACRSEDQAKWRTANPEKVKENNARWYAKNIEKARAYSREYAAKNKEQVKLTIRRWRENNKDRVKALMRAWYIRNAEYVKQVSRMSYQSNKERHAALGRAWKQRNKEKVRESSRRYYEKNKDKALNHWRTRYARKKQVGGKLSVGLRDRLYMLQKGKCACCGKSLKNKSHLDHIMPIALGGQNVDSNIQLLCAWCNQSKNAQHPIDFMQKRGFLL